MMRNTSAMLLNRSFAALTTTLSSGSFGYRFVIVAIALMASSVTAVAGPVVTTPTGLGSGDEYRLIFATSGTTAATSTDITYYNNFVTNLANAVPQLAALDTTWRVVGETSAVTAKANTGTDPGNAADASVPIYLVDGSTEIAADNAAFWSGTHLHGIDVEENGSIVASSPQLNIKVFTGIGDATDSTVSGPLGSTDSTIGHTTAVNYNWSSNGAYLSTQPLRLYGISGVLTVPEPGSVTLLLVGLGALGVARRRRASKRR